MMVTLLAGEPSMADRGREGRSLGEIWKLSAVRRDKGNQSSQLPTKRMTHSMVSPSGRGSYKHAIAAAISSCCEWKVYSGMSFCGDASWFRNNVDHHSREHGGHMLKSLEGGT